jgi:hypothetical protein
MLDCDLGKQEPVSTSWFIYGGQAILLSINPHVCRGHNTRLPK